MLRLAVFCRRLQIEEEAHPHHPGFGNRVARLGAYAANEYVHGLQLATLGTVAFAVLALSLSFGFAVAPHRDDGAPDEDKDKRKPKRKAKRKANKPKRKATKPKRKPKPKPKRKFDSAATVSETMCFMGATGQPSTCVRPMFVLLSQSILVHAQIARQRHSPSKSRRGCSVARAGLSA
jgi:hypothetical protein